jgi:hypothetical protein
MKTELITMGDKFASNSFTTPQVCNLQTSEHHTSHSSQPTADARYAAVHAQAEAWGRTIGELDWLAEAALRGEA